MKGSREKEKGAKGCVEVCTDVMDQELTLENALISRFLTAKY